MPLRIVDHAPRYVCPQSNYPCLFVPWLPQGDGRSRQDRRGSRDAGMGRGMSAKESRRARIRRQKDLRRMRLLRKDNSRINRIWDQWIKDGTAVWVAKRSFTWDTSAFHGTWGVIP